MLAFRRDQTLIVALLYGEESDWLRNLRAGGGHVVRAGGTFKVGGTPRVGETGTAAEMSMLAAPARAYCRLAEQQVVLQLGEKLPGFGPRRLHP